MTRKRIGALAAVLTVALVSCSARGSDSNPGPEQEATPVETEPAPPSEADLFERPDRLPLSTPLLGMLPGDARMVVVLAAPDQLRSWLAVSEWSVESREAAGEELRQWLGVNLLDAAAVEAAGLAASQALVFAELDASVFALVAPVADEQALRKALGREKGRRVVVRDRYAAIVVGPATGKALAMAVAAVEATGEGASLADSEELGATTSSLNVGKDVAVYAAARAPVSRVAVGMNLRDRSVMAQVVLHLSDPSADWKSWLVRELGTPDLKQKPVVASAKIDAIRTVCDAAENLSVNADTVRPRSVARARALDAAMNAGILGSLAFTGGNSKKAKKKRAQLEAAEATLRELEEARDSRVAELERLLRSALGSAVGYARVDGDNVVIYGGQFFADPTAAVVARAAELWLAGSARIAAGRELAEQERRVDKLRSQLSEISAREMFGGGAFASLTGTGDFTSGLSDVDVYGGLLGEEVGEMKGGFGYGIRGTGPGGGGTGWGTIGTGSVGTIGHGGGGTGAGYGSGRGYGRIGGRGASPKATLQSGGDEVLRGYLDRKMGRVLRCYKQALDRDAKLAGTVDVQLSADEAGAVTAHATGVADRKLANCVAVAAGGKSADAAGRAGSFSISLDPGK